jgi:hypothetical protein
MEPAVQGWHQDESAALRREGGEKRVSVAVGARKGGVCCRAAH